jgi:hypothetical protein
MKRVLGPIIRLRLPGTFQNSSAQRVLLLFKLSFLNLYVRLYVQLLIQSARDKTAL